MEDLPLEIQSKILSCVPLEYAVLSCKHVSKTWKTLLSHRKLKGGLLFSIATHRELPKLCFGYPDEVLSLPWAADSAEEDEEICFSEQLTEIKLPISQKGLHAYSCTGADVIGSCNGLICLSMRFIGFHAPNYCVLNPFTGEYFELPTIDNDKIRGVGGFGYDPSNDNYKIVCIQYPAPSNDKGLVQVYTLGEVCTSGGWRNVGEISSVLPSEGILNLECVLWNGSLHWLDVHQRKIVAFDLADEKFRYIPISNKHIHHQTQLKLLAGYLSIVDRGNERINIWSFKNEHNDVMVVQMEYQSWNWCLEFSIPTFPPPRKYLYYACPGSDSYDCYDSDSYEAFAITKNSEVLLWHCTYDIHESHSTRPIFLCRYDRKTDTLNKVLNLETYEVSMFQGIPHVHSLVSLKALGVDSKTTAEVAANVRFTMEEVKQYLTTCTTK